MNFALPVAGIALEQIVIRVGIPLTLALGILFFGQKVDQKTHSAVMVIAAEASKEGQELHLPWEKLTPYQGKVRRGKSSKNKTYFYEKDDMHTDVEVYKVQGSKGIHIGSVSRAGGAITKGPVPGRKIKV